MEIIIYMEVDLQITSSLRFRGISVNKSVTKGDQP